MPFRFPSILSDAKQFGKQMHTWLCSLQKEPGAIQTKKPNPEKAIEIRIGNSRASHGVSCSLLLNAA